MMIEITIN